MLSQVATDRSPDQCRTWVPLIAFPEDARTSRINRLPARRRSPATAHGLRASLFGSMFAIFALIANDVPARLSERSEAAS
jgi:hypothetical protein